MEFRNYRDGDESRIVDLLNLVYEHWGSIEHWKHKYRNNTRFDPRLIFVAEDNDTIVSCVQYLRRDLKLGNGILDSYIGGDGGTLPKYASKSLFTKGLNVLYDEVRRKKGCLVYGYNNEAIYNGFYRKRFGEVAVHRPYVMIRILDANRLIASILPVANRALRNIISSGNCKSLTIRLELRDQPPLDLCIVDNRIKLCRLSTKPEIKIRAHVKDFLEVFSGGHNPLKAFLLRRIRISISPLALARLLLLAIKIRWKT